MTELSPMASGASAPPGFQTKPGAWGEGECNGQDCHQAAGFAGTSRMRSMRVSGGGGGSSSSGGSSLRRPRPHGENTQQQVSPQCAVLSPCGATVCNSIALTPPGWRGGSDRQRRRLTAPGASRPAAPTGLPSHPALRCLRLWPALRRSHWLHGVGTPGWVSALPLQTVAPPGPRTEQ